MASNFVSAAPLSNFGVGVVVRFLRTNANAEGFADDCLSYVLDCPRPATDRLADLGVTPRRPVSVSLK